MRTMPFAEQAEYMPYEFDRSNAYRLDDRPLPRRLAQYRPQAVRPRRTPSRIDSPIFVGGPPVRPFWRRSPWSDAIAIVLFVIVLVAAVNAVGGFTFL